MGRIGPQMVSWEESDPRCVPWEECDPRCVPWEESDPLWLPGRNITPDGFYVKNITSNISLHDYGITGIWPPTLIIARLILAEGRSMEVDTPAHHVPWEEHDP